MKITLIIILLFASFIKIEAQTNNSPYSIFGIGDIEDSYFNRTSGLANTGIAYRSSRYLINNNPASFSALDNDFFAGELGGRATFINYFGANVATNYNQSFDITFRKLALGIKPSKHWGTSIGLQPYSTQNYEFNTPLNIDNATGQIANQYFEGSGGINKVYWANSYEFFKHLSLGVNASYLFGSLQQKVILQNPITLSELVSTTNNVNLTNFSFDYGMQFYTNIGKKWDFSIGATYSNKANLKVLNTQVVLNPDSSQLYSVSYPISHFTLPTSFGAGISLTYNKKYTFVADYKHQSWSSVKYTGPTNVPGNSGYTNGLLLNTSGYNYYLQNSDRISVGFEISKKKSVSMGQYNVVLERMYYQGGFYYSNSYLNVFGQQIKDIGASLGIGVNSKRTPLAYTFSVQYGIKGVQNIQLIEERYLNFTISISYRDFWLTKGRKFF